MDDTWQFAGLPLHPLLVHVVVVLVPLTAIALLIGQFWPAARRRLGAVTPLAALLVLALVPVTVTAGENLARLVGPLPAVQTHEAYGRMLLPWAAAMFAVAVAQWAWYRWGAARMHESRPGLTRTAGWVLAVAGVVVAVGSTATIVLIGDSGARAVWGGLIG